MKYKAKYNSDLPFHSHYDANGDIVYMTVMKGDVLDDQETPFNDLSLKMLQEEGLLRPLSKAEKEKEK